MYLFIYPIKREGCSLYLYLGKGRLKVAWLSSLCNFCFVLWSMTPYLYVSISFHIFISHKIDATFSRSISNCLYFFRVLKKVVGNWKRLQLIKVRLLALVSLKLLLRSLVHIFISFTSLIPQKEKSFNQCHLFQISMPPPL